MKQKIQTILIIILCLSIIFLLLKGCNERKESTELNDAINASLDTSRNQLNQQRATILALKTSQKKDFLKIKTKDSTIQWLQKTIKEYKGKLSSAIVISNVTESKGKTVTIISHDTINNEIYPTYFTKINNEWESGYILATKDSIKRDIKFKNEYQVTIGDESNDWFKKREFKVSILNLNPNTYTTELRSYNVSTKPKRFTIGIQAGYGVNLLTMRQALYLGVGANYTIISIK